MSTHSTAHLMPSFFGQTFQAPAPPAQKSVSPQADKKSSKTDSVGVRARAGNKEGARMQCPHCKHPALKRNSMQITPLTRESLHYCTNPECGHTFVALTEIVRTLSPSATPDPSVRLPLSSHVRRDLLRATLDHAGTAEHQTQFTEPVNGDLFAEGPPAD